MFSSFKKRTLFLILIIVVVFCYSAQTTRMRLEDKYELAVQKMDSKDYEGALSELNELEGFKDSDELVEKVQNYINYNQAKTLFDRKEYEQALELFLSLKEKNFEDSGEYVDKVNKQLKIDGGNRRLYNEAIECFRLENYAEALAIFTSLKDYNYSQQMVEICKTAIRLENSVTIAAGTLSSAAVTKEGTVFFSGPNALTKEEINSISNWHDIVSVAVGGEIAVGLQKDGKVVTAGRIRGYNIDTSDWEDIVAISAGDMYIAGLKSDGTIVTQGHNGDGQRNVNNWINIVAISSGWRHTVGLDSNGEIHIAGYKSNSQMEEIRNKKDEWTDIVAISAGGGQPKTLGEDGHTVALKKDGTVVAVGDNYSGQCNVNTDEWRDIVAVSAGASHTVGLKSNKTVVTTDTGKVGEEVRGWTDIVAVAAGYHFTLGLKADGTVVGAGYNINGQRQSDEWRDITWREEWKDIAWREEWNLVFDN